MFRSTFNVQPHDVLDHLQAQHLTIAATDDDDQFADLLKSQLVDSGVGVVNIVGRQAVTARIPDSSFVVSLTEMADHAWHDELDAMCFAHSVPWMRALFYPGGSSAKSAPCSLARILLAIAASARYTVAMTAKPWPPVAM